MYALGQVHKSSSPSSSRPSASSRWRIQSRRKRASTDTRDDSTELLLVEGQFQFQFRARNLVPSLVTGGLSASRIRAEPQFRLIKTSDLAWISKRVRKSPRANKPLLFPDRARGGIYGPSCINLDDRYDIVVLVVEICIAYSPWILF